MLTVKQITKILFFFIALFYTFNAHVLISVNHILFRNSYTLDTLHFLAVFQCIVRTATSLIQTAFFYLAVYSDSTLVLNLIMKC